VTFKIIKIDGLGKNQWGQSKKIYFHALAGQRNAEIGLFTQSSRLSWGLLNNPLFNFKTFASQLSKS